MNLKKYLKYFTQKKFSLKKFFFFILLIIKYNSITRYNVFLIIFIFKKSFRKFNIINLYLL